MMDQLLKDQIELGHIDTPGELEMAGLWFGFSQMLPISFEVVNLYSMLQMKK